MNPTTQTRVLVADDSVFVRTALTRMIESDPSLKVVGTAINGAEALEKAASLDPDVVTLDIQMPVLGGMRVLKQLMAENPRPVIVVSSLSQEGAEAMLEAFDYGAFECIAKPLGCAHLDIIRIRQELVAKVKAAATAGYLRHPKPVLAATPTSSASSFHDRPSSAPGTAPKVVALGSSTGGPKALQEIISSLPADLPVGMVVVQHMPRGFTAPFARRLDSLSRVRVREAEQDDTIQPGLVLLAPAGRQMTVYRRAPGRYAVRLADTPNDTPHMPSVDVLMHSVADVFGSQAMGVILTGMGSDGAQGMKQIYDCGGLTVGQDEASCVVYGMPRACAERGVLKRVAPLSEMAAEIVAATC